MVSKTFNEVSVCRRRNGGAVSVRNAVVPSEQFGQMKLMTRYHAVSVEKSSFTGLSYYSREVQRLHQHQCLFNVHAERGKSILFLVVCVGSVLIIYSASRPPDVDTLNCDMNISI